MKRQTRGSAYDISIHRDVVEQNRRQLENRLKSNISTIPAPPLASDDDDGDGEEDYYHYHQSSSSVEYPRHDSGPMPYPDFPSFAHRSREHHFQEEDSHMHMGWSYRTADDDDGVNPYGGETMSTAAHHASAVTITAGLGGGRGGHRRDISMSGAEYDPERPLNQIMAGVGRMSMLDDPSKSKHTVQVTSDPIVVDSTAELDRILQSGYAPHNRSIHPTPPMSHASSSSSDTEPGSPPRAKLSDHLRSIPFSPKRPRNPQPPSPVAQHHHHHHRQPQASPLAKRNQGNATMLSANNSANMSTPRPARRVSNPVQQTPEVRLQPATPSTSTTSNSRFTRMARGITKEITETQSRAREDGQYRPSSAPPMQQHQQHKKPSASEPASKQDTAPKSNLSRRNFSRDLSKSRVVLPDVTGLTAAVESPARLGTTYYPYKGAGSREAEARLLQTLSQVQSKLQQLNDENGISRRRVRELEMELDECKRDVARERTRLLEQEEVIVQQQRELASGTGTTSSKAKGKAKERERVREKEVVAVEDSEEVMKRYKDAVEEKKALEALINSLRSHLTRLTSELASHTDLLQELRELRETDSRSLREKGNDIARLKEDVERLEGEVEVLRGVVEEGLRERRAGREASMVQEPADIGMSRDLEEDDEEEEEEEEEEEVPERHADKRSQRSARQQEFSLAPASDSSDDDEELDLSLASRRQADRTMRTDHATLGSSTTTPHRVQFLDQQELQRIAAEVEERRSDRSFSMNESHNPLPSPRSRSPSLERHGLEQPSFVYAERPPRPTTPIPPSSPSPRPQAKLPLSKGHHPTAATTSRKPSSSRHQAAETPFPQIRGERLERLFFSAPEHNPKTCTVCFRRRRSESGDEDDDDEGAGHDHHTHEHRRRGRGGRADPIDQMAAGMVSRNELGEVPSDASYFRRVGNQAGLPPQTMAMRVIRELEDDFTHYKSIYVELADQYKEMDPVSDVPRRNMLAKHLREVVDVLERKGDQIASLSDLLAFKDQNSKAKV